MDADVDIVFLGQFLAHPVTIGEAVDTEMNADVVGAGQLDEFVFEAFFFLVAISALDADGDDLDTGGAVGLDDPLETTRVLEVRVHATEFNFVQAALADQFGHLGVVFEMAETVALHAEIGFQVHGNPLRGTVYHRRPPKDSVCNDPKWAIDRKFPGSVQVRKKFPGQKV